MQAVQGEASVGIKQYTTQDVTGIGGILKQRYSDFVVREIDLKGEVARLKELNAKGVEKSVFQKEEVSCVGQEDVVEELLRAVRELVPLGQVSGATEEGKDGAKVKDDQALGAFLVACVSRQAECPTDFVAFPCTVKETRTAAHKAIKSIAANFVDSDTVNIDGVQHIRLLAKHKQQRGKKRRRDQWPAGVGDYLKFKILKENIDTMSAANYMAGTLNCKKDFLKFSGTKDKRAITVQWATAYRLHPIALHRLNTFRYPPTIRCGDFEYVNEPLQLGKLKGNRFEIVLREVSCDSSHVDTLCRKLVERGFLNYYGLQRFGKGGSGNHLIGRALLQSNWKEAIDFMFTPKAGDREEVVNMKQHYFNGDYIKAKDAVPSFSYYSEKYCLQGLCSNPKDFFGAFQRIPRNTKFICGHAFQSYIWNMAASERVRSLGVKVAVGDLVFLSSDIELEDAIDDDTVALRETEEKVASIMCVTGENINESVHVVTEDDVQSNRFISTDIVLPLLGFNSMLPDNCVGSFIQQMLDENNVSLEMFRKHPFFQFSGSYRRVFSSPGNFEWETIPYSERNTDILSTELQSFVVQSCGVKKQSESDDVAVNGVASSSEVSVSENNNKASSQYLAAVLRFSLPAGSYATMLLRELMKTSTDTAFHSNLTSTSASASCDQKE